MYPSNTTPSPYPHSPNEPSQQSPQQAPLPEVGPREQPIHAPIPPEQPHPALPEQPIGPDGPQNARARGGRF